MHPDPIGEHTLRIIAKASQFNYWVYKTIYPNLKGKVLEIGSGLGNISQYLIKDGFHITLSDFNPDYCTLLKKHFEKYPNVNDILSINLQDEAFFSKYEALKGAFDTVYLLNVLEHLNDDKKAIAYCHYLLKENGNIILLVPAFRFLYCNLDKNLGHFRRYNDIQLKTLLRASRF
jgi:2-polyprenyl-3-methyl-5-hydroxy-6-metoxy-1,4-benzoquinol methylase